MNSLSIDNFEIVNKIVQWKPNYTYYKFMAIIRKKDCNNIINVDRDYCVKYWLVDSKDCFEKLKDEMKQFIIMFNCRLYMTTDRHSIIKSLKSLRNNICDQLDLFLVNKDPQYNINMFMKLFDSSTQHIDSTEHDFRRWLFDIDTKNQYVLNTIQNSICKDKYLATFKTKNGFHIVAKKEMDACKLLKESRDLIFKYGDKNLGEELIRNVEIKTNSLVLVAMV